MTSTICGPRSEPGKALFTATSEAHALDTLGATTVGVDVLTAVDAAAAGTTLEISPGMSSTERQNFLFSTAYQSKPFAEYRRPLNQFATGFKGANDTANGIDTNPSSNYSVDSSGGKVSPSNGPTSRRYWTGVSPL
ncbi:MAG: hypothetical protein ACTHM2_09670 [Afipia sp.]